MTLVTGVTSSYWTIKPNFPINNGIFQFIYCTFLYPTQPAVLGRPTNKLQPAIFNPQTQTPRLNLLLELSSDWELPHWPGSHQPLWVSWFITGAEAMIILLSPHTNKIFLTVKFLLGRTCFPDGWQPCCTPLGKSNKLGWTFPHKYFREFFNFRVCKDTFLSFVTHKQESVCLMSMWKSALVGLIPLLTSLSYLGPSVRTWTLTRARILFKYWFFYLSV